MSKKKRQLHRAEVGRKVTGGIKGIFSPIIEAQKEKKAAIKRVKQAKAINHTIDREVEELAKKYQISKEDARAYIVHERKKQRQKEELKKGAKKVGKGLLEFAKKVDKYTEEYAERQKKSNEFYLMSQKKKNRR